MSYRTPNKPAKQADQIDMMWDAIFNDLGHKTYWLGKMITFLLAAIAIVIGLQAATLVVALAATR